MHFKHRRDTGALFDLLDASAAEAHSRAELLLKLTTQFGLPDEEATLG
jgi:hypothetical protein